MTQPDPFSYRKRRSELLLYITRWVRLKNSACLLPHSTHYEVPYGNISAAFNVPGTELPLRNEHKWTQDKKRTWEPNGTAQCNVQCTTTSEQKGTKCIQMQRRNFNAPNAEEEVLRYYKNLPGYQLFPLDCSENSANTLPSPGERRLSRGYM